RSVGDRRCAFDHDVCVGRVSGAFLRAGGQRVTGVEGKTQLEDRHEQRDENQRHQDEIDNSRPGVNVHAGVAWRVTRQLLL
ncbi:MAG: hypothetical protein QOG69_2350, partial [Actinomycetota bacterium]|nr:hypothetical protein [Actinomycetota bacterium]